MVDDVLPIHHIPLVLQ